MKSHNMVILRGSSAHYSATVLNVLLMGHLLYTCPQVVCLRTLHTHLLTCSTVSGLFLTKLQTAVESPNT